MEAIDIAVSFARSHQATLVPLVLLHVAQREHPRGVRLEFLQQAQDFLEAVSHKAVKNNVAVERFEVVTPSVEESIAYFTASGKYAGLLLFMRDSKGILLSLSEIKALLLQEHKGLSFYVVYLPSRRHARRVSGSARWFASWFNRGQKPQTQQTLPSTQVELYTGQHDLFSV